MKMSTALNLKFKTKLGKNIQNNFGYFGGKER